MLQLLMFFCWASVATGSAGRTLMFWQVEASDQILNTLKAHKENVTGVSPCIYQFDANGNFGHQAAYWNTISPYLSKYVEMGLDVFPLIGAQGSVTGLPRLGKRFIDDAVAEALKMGYKGYNFDNELRGSTSDASCSPLVRFAGPWISFLNEFADALHAHNLTLSVDLEGCCGWIDTEHPTLPAGHCAGAFATHEFVATTCQMYKGSRIDKVYAMDTYSDSVNVPASDPHRYGFNVTLEQVHAAQQGVGKNKYSLGIKGGWPYCSDPTNVSTCVFDDEAKENIRHLRDDIGVQHISSWAGLPHSQAQWDLWGFFLHGEKRFSSSPTIV